MTCRRPNVISCDRVGLAVWLKHPTNRLNATINGRAVAMHMPCGNPLEPYSCRSYCRDAKKDQPCGTFFEGFLRPAGLLNGPLKVRPDRGNRWLGRNPPAALVRLRGDSGATKLRVRLSTGWG